MRFIIISAVICLCKSEADVTDNTTLAVVPEEVTFTIEPDNATAVAEELEEERIFHGRNANAGQFKYQVLLEIHKNGKASRCGGALISASYVLTAAHCTIASSKVVMYFGLIYANEKHKAVQRHSVYTIIHPSYNSRTLENDISILKTNSAVPRSRYIGTIRLPMRSQSSPDHFANLEAIASGWGRTTNNEAGGHSRLQWARLHMPKQSLCKNYLHRYNYNTNVNICTDKRNNNRASPCKGDSGGPLAYFPIRGDPVLIGLVSWGAGECDNQLPNAYTRVAAFLTYITRKTGIRIQ